MSTPLEQPPAQPDLHGYTPEEAFEMRVRRATDELCAFDPDAAAYRQRTEAWVRLVLAGDLRRELELNPQYDQPPVSGDARGVGELRERARQMVVAVAHYLPVETYVWLRDEVGALTASTNPAGEADVSSWLAKAEVARGIGALPAGEAGGERE